MPPGFARSTYRGSQVQLRDPQSRRTLRVDWSDSPAPSALAAWQANPELRVTNVGSTTIAGGPATVADLAPKSGVRRVRVIALTGGDFSTGDDGTGGPPIAVVLTQSPSGRLVIAMIFLGPRDARPPAQAVVQSLAFP